MAMKTKVFSASLLLAGLAFAGTTEVTDEYVLGAMPLTISGSEVIINIPWVEAGSGGSTIAVSNLVKTTGLTAGDNLLWYNPSDSKYRIWEATAHADVLYWDAVSSITEIDATKVASDSPALGRGQALILKRASSESTTIYIVGQYTSASATSTIYHGFNLLAPTATSGTTELTTLFGTSNPVAGDQIITSEGVGYVWSSEHNKWGSWSYADGWIFSEATNITIPAGKGFWYNRKGDDSFSVTW